MSIIQVHAKGAKKNQREERKERQISLRSLRNPLRPLREPAHDIFLRQNHIDLAMYVIQLAEVSLLQLNFNS
jgi:hypothetical protein